MVRKGLRISWGASGLGSHISMWVGPPESQNKMTDFFAADFGLIAAWLCRASNAGSDNPAPPVSPVCRNHRLDRWQIKSLAGMKGEARDAAACCWAWVIATLSGSA